MEQTTAEHVAIKVRTFSPDEWDVIKVNPLPAQLALEAFLNDPANAPRLAGRTWTAAYAEDEHGTVSLYVVELHVEEAPAESGA